MGRCLYGMVAHLWSQANSVNVVAISSDCQTIALPTDDHSTSLWNSASEAHEKAIDLAEKVKSVTFSDDGKTLRTNLGLVNISSDLLESSQLQRSSKGKISFSSY